MPTDGHDETPARSDPAVTRGPSVITDLTMPLREGIAAFGSHGRSVLELNPVMRHADFDGKGRFNNYDDAPISFAVTQWLLGDQAGTHMDAPWHANAASPLTADKIPLRYGFGPGIWIDCGAAMDEGGVSVEILEAGLAAADAPLLPGDVVLLRTGSSDHADSNPNGYANRAVGLTRAAGEWLREAQVKTVGIDCVTIESRETAATADVHTNFLKPTAIGNDPGDVIGIIENLVSLDAIPARRFLFSGLPLPLVGAAGGSIRAVAIVERADAPVPGMEGSDLP